MLELFKGKDTDDFEEEIARRKKEAEKENKKIQEQIAPEPSYPAQPHINKKGEKVGITGKVYNAPRCQ